MSMDKLQLFFESTYGQIATVSVIAILFFIILFSGKSKKPDTKGLVISAVFVALYVALNQVIIFRMPQGGSITALSMLTIALCGYFLGIRRGVMAGMCAGLIDLIFNPYVIHPIQLFLDYPLAAGSLGFAGLFKESKYGLMIGYLFGVMCRYVCAFLSGIVFFGEYAPETFNSFSWSLYYNIMYIGPEAVLTTVILLFPPVSKALKRLKAEID